MAQRGEGQGLQIAVISFAMLTIILAITTYVFYAQSATAQKDLEAKNKTLAEKQSQNDKLTYSAVAMQYVLGLRGVTIQEVDLAKSKAGGESPEVKEILDNFAADMALVGEQVAPEGPRNYRTFSTVLLAAVNKKNASVSDANDQSRKAQQDRIAAEQAATARAETAETSSKKAADDYSAEAQKFAADRAKNEEEKNALNTQITAGSTKAKTDLQKVIDEKDLFVKQNTQLLQTNRMLQGRIDDYKKGQADLFESPDGHIKLVNQRQRLVWIDVGRAEGLLRQTTFSVYDHDENGVSSAKPKARIEVVGLGDHLSEARILEDTPANPIIGGDVIHTPAWSPGQRVHFALAMKMDINKDGVDDYEMVKNIIQMNGGVIDAELRPDGSRDSGNISVNTRYFVEGEKPSESTSAEMQKQYNAFDGDRERFNVQKISVEKLLSLMGWKAEERVVELSGNRGAGDFRKRSPGKSQPAGAAPSSEAAAPGASEPAAPAPAGVDPFASPAAPPAAADPFAAQPAGKAAPAAENDPFK